MIVFVLLTALTHLHIVYHCCNQNSAVIRKMESADSEQTSSGDESDDENGLKNAYSVGDLLGELSSDDNCCYAKHDGNDPDLADQDPDDSVSPGSSMPVNTNHSPTSDKPDEAKDSTLEEKTLKYHNVPNAGDTIPVAGRHSHVYDEVLIENIYQDPAENSDHLVTSK